MKLTTQDVLRHVHDEPRDATRIYRAMVGVPLWKSLTRRERRERKWVATKLELLANEGVVHRGIFETGYITWVGWWRNVDAIDAAFDQPGVRGAHAELRQERGVGES